MINFISIEYNINYINNKLIPWKNNNNDKFCKDIIMGIIIDNKIITTFKVYMLYANCKLINDDYFEKDLEIIDYCYYRRLITFKIKDEQIILNNNINNIENFDFNRINYDDIYFNLLNDQIYKTNAKLKPISMDGSNVYPFIFAESLFNNSDAELLNSEDGIISGTPVYNNENNIIGLIYNIVSNNISNRIIIIPLITIYNYIKIKYSELSNIFSKIKYNIIRINDIPVLNDNINYSNIEIPYNTYLWYDLNNTISFQVENNGIVNKLNIRKKLLKDKLNISIEIETICLYKIRKIKYCKPNLLLFEWLNYNNIIINSISINNYYTKPFYKRKHEYIIVYIHDYYRYNTSVINKLDNYLSNLNNYIDNIELLTIYSDITSNNNYLYIYESNNKKFLININ